MLAHFDSNAVAVPWAVEVGVFALLVGGHVLEGDFVIHGVVPDEVADAVAALAFGGAEGAAFECERVFPCIGTVILCAVDGDVARGHGAEYSSAVGAFWHEILA